MEINFFSTDSVKFSPSVAEERQKSRAELRVDKPQFTAHYTTNLQRTLINLYSTYYTSFIKYPQMKNMMFTLQSHHLSSVLHIYDTLKSCQTSLLEQQHRYVIAVRMCHPPGSSTGALHPQLFIDYN